MDFVVAIGDIHGCLVELQELIDRCKTYMKEAKFKFVFLGDYVDRGPDSEGCVRLVKSMVEADEAIALMGNHEEMAIQALHWGIRNHYRPSGGLNFTGFYDRRVGDMPAELFDWLRTLPRSYETEKQLFVHAGIDPFLSIKDQDPEQLIWIRAPFLNFTGPFPKYVVHGHSPTNWANEWNIHPHVLPNRCNLDTGCVFGGQLSAGIFDLTKEMPISTISVPLKTNILHRSLYNE